MRRGLLIFLLFTLAILGFVLNQVWTLLSLLVVGVTGDAILRSELPASGSPREEGKKQIIPKIIHQTYKTTTIPPEYERFYETYAGYKYPMQPADAIRYFVLAHYGGIYIDDDGCNRSLEPLLVYPFFVRRTIPTGISNDVMGAVPGHPFFVRVSERIKNHDHGWWCSRLAMHRRSPSSSVIV
ncbi:CSG1/SUR1-like protein [Elasticomyces elasticus]|nr:CSG1/SUR1-like protein [Elasticomyces elasticus]KAK5674016.1 CSG1/SUR1-like protein [Elasticomyces elasticus]